MNACIYDPYVCLCGLITVQAPAPQTSSGESAPKGTYAFFPTSESTGNCAAAVEYWKGGYSLFSDKLPEKYSDAKPGTYGNEKAVSFVALFNPKPNPTVSCVFVKCPAGTTSSSTKATEKDSGGGVGGRRLQDADGSSTVNAVICLTAPEALVNDEAPFR